MISRKGKLFTVITSIFPPKLCVQELGLRLKATLSPIVLVGDKKGPSKFDMEGAIFLPFKDQEKLGFKISELMPTGHYARKNIGYLYAMGHGASCIYETDDDNAPNDHWEVRSKQVSARKLKHNGWVNVYKYFTDKLIWPRGLPLDLIKKDCVTDKLSAPELVTSPIQQGLVDGSPDVDAAWRLILGKEFTFSQEHCVYLEPGAWCPFNSQNTWWWQNAYPLMYLPSSCSFRMTDIWRGFIAQRCLWEMGSGIVFHAPDVYQDRNEHNLMRDFEAEVPGYLGNISFTKILQELELTAGPGSAAVNLYRCYDALIREGYLAKEEMDLVEAWCDDVASVMNGTKLE